MKNKNSKIALVTFAMLASPLLLARASAEDQSGVASVYSTNSEADRKRSEIEPGSPDRCPSVAAVRHQSARDEQEQRALGGRDHQRSRPLHAWPGHRCHARGSARARNLGTDEGHPRRRRLARDGRGGSTRRQCIVAAHVRAYTATMTEQPTTGTPQASPADPNAECPHCRKPRALCVCEGISADRQQGVAAHPAASAGAGSRARHRAAHGAALQGRTAQDRPVVAEPHQDPRPPGRSAALGDPLSRLGQGRGGPARSRHRGGRTRTATPSIDQDAALREIEGIILLDGTWSQAKALWWRNALDAQVQARRARAASARRVTASCGASPAATGSRPSRRRPCCWRGSNASRRSRPR